MKITESCSALTITNTDMSSEYVTKKRNAACAQHQIMITKYVASEMHQ